MQLASSVIGPGGGTVSANGVTLEIPPGALSRDTEITIGLATDVDTSTLPGGVRAAPAGPPYQFGPSGLRFAVPVRATVPANGSNDLVIALRDDVTGQVELLRPESAVNGTLSVMLEHFSTSQPISSQEPPPSALSLVPASGEDIGGESVIIQGNDFRPGSPPLEVYFGTRLAPFANVVTSTVIPATATEPARATAIVVRTPRAAQPGPVSVTVRNSDGPSVTVPNAFTYVPRPPGPPAHLNVITPTGVVAGSPFSVQVELLDAQTAVSTSATNTVTIFLGNTFAPPGVALPVLGGNLTAAAVNGVATFPGLTIDVAGTGNLIVANSPGLPSAGSSAFTVAAGPASRLAFMQEPSDTFTVGAMSPAVQVQVLDAFGNSAPTTDSITLTLSGTGGGSLAGANPRSAVQGVATFWDLSVSQAGTYTLRADAGGLTGATSASFMVSEASPVWRAVAATPSPRGVARATVGPDGRIYLSGSSATASTTSVDVWDPRSEVWTSVPSFSSPRRYFAMATGPDGRVYVLGGLDASGARTGVAEAYSTASGTWTTVASMPVARAWFPAVTGNDGFVYVFQGLSTQDPTGSTFSGHRFSPISGAWTQVAGYFAGSASTYYAHAGTLAPDGLLYFFGGSRESSVNGFAPVTNNFARYDSTTDTWSGSPGAPTARRGGGAATGPDGRLYFVGGSYGMTALIPSSCVEAYDLQASTFVRLPGLRTPRAEVAVVRGVDGRIYALGGTDPDGTPLASMEAYGPSFGLSPATGAPGTTVALVGENFAFSANVSVFLGDTSGTLLATGTTNQFGQAAVSFQVPAGTPSGSYVVTAVDAISGFPVNVPFTVP